MEQIINLRIEKLPSGGYLATSQDMPDLVAHGRNVTETLEIAKNSARKILSNRSERSAAPVYQTIGDDFQYPLIVGA